MNLDIKYSIEGEITRVKNTLDKLDWFKKQGYQIYLPQKLSLEKISYEDILKTSEHIRNAILDEYSAENYDVDSKYILSNKKYINDILDIFFKSTLLKSQKTYKINLTRYGVGGSYHTPDTIIINIRLRREMKLIKTIIHEVIHLSIQQFIDKYKIDHWKKERLVDLIMNKIAPEINTMQEIPIETEKIDKIFKENYPHIENIMKII